MSRGLSRQQGEGHVFSGGMVWGPLAPESYLQIPEAREQT